MVNIDVCKIIGSHIYLGLGLVLFLGYVFGRISGLLKIPRVTGYLIAGILIGPSFLNIFNEANFAYVSFVPYLALGIIALTIGAGLSFDVIKHIKYQLVSITLFEALGAFILTLIVLLVIGTPYGATMPLAAIACATAPAATIAVIKEYRAYGSLTNMILGVVALDDAIAMFLFSLILTFDFSSLTGFGMNIIHAINHFLFGLFNSIILGIVLAVIANYIFCKKAKIDNTIILLAMIFLGVGLSNVMHISYLITNMVFGFTLINLNMRNKESIQEIEKYTDPIYCLFFVIAGTHLDLTFIGSLGFNVLLWAGFFILFRMLGKILGAYLGARLSKAPEKIRRNIGFSLVPMAGVAIGLTLLIDSSSYYYAYRSIILNVTLVAVAVNEIIGPFFAKYALVRAKEAVLNQG
jgi:Kef-type K+ transport system membrane component KefB